MDLKKRRDEVAAANQLLEKTRGSGWHPADLGAEAREKANEMELSKRPITLVDRDQVLMVEPDLTVIREGVSRFLTRLDAARARAIEKDWDEPDLVGYGLPFQKTIVKECRTFLKQEVNGHGGVGVSTGSWNCINQILNMVGIQVFQTVAEAPDYSDL